MRGDAGLLELIASIYEAAVEPTLWPGVLERVADALGWLEARASPRDGRLAAGRHPDGDRVACAVARAAGRTAAPSAAEALRIDRDGERRPLHLWAVPLPRGAATPLIRAPNGHVMMIVVDPELSAAPPIEARKALYGLTGAEARLTRGLLHGERLEDYAARTGISMNTARTHLKSIFAKTATDRQAELMRLLSRATCRPD